ncbi:hypothetical protein HK097_009386 [Rhizophlyctis rosea]|uniref:DUF7719 domain-containing protein n=1 Tax=Rhizophlyctis rosea TaxID=64517 RepID=A0AAD5SH96_9FUNG|nr:hypothetical protein HK097_009386 [Rhizophlyctis rosea]
MPTPKKRKDPSKTPSKPPVEYTEEEQWRIINETGILQKVAENDKRKPKPKSKRSREPEDEDIPPGPLAFLFALPLTVLHGGMDYIVHLQYDYGEHFTFKRVLSRQLPLFPVLVLFIYFTTKYKNLLVSQLLFTIASAAAGVGLVYFSTEDQTFGAMLKTPGLAVLWIYLVIQMRLPLACLSLLGTFLYYHKKWFEAGKIGNLND